MSGNCGELTGNLDLSVVIPAYNAESYIEDTTRKLVDGLQELDLTWEVIVVDDGSSDNTATSIFSHPQVRAIKLAENSGKGAAVKAGMLAATGNVRIFTDADLPYGTKPIKPTVDYIRNRCFHAVVGDRTLPGSEYGHAGFFRRVISGIASFLFRTLITGGVYDTQCGFKGFRGDVAEALFPLITITRFAVDVEIIYLLLKYRLDIKRLRVKLENHSESTVHVFRDTFRAVVDIAKLRRNWVMRRYNSPALFQILRDDH
jgi:dolichyl-phosphate beta-glucosyltransferase